MAWEVSKIAHLSTYRQRLWRVSLSVAIVLHIAFFATAAHAASIKDKNFGNAIVKEVTSVYDGDTFRANIEGWPGIVGERIGIRINGIDTPEMRGKCDQEKRLAREAKQIAVSALRSAKKVELRNMKRGKYFRIVADVYADGKSVGDTLISSGLAVPYDGGTKAKNWCE